MASESSHKQVFFIDINSKHQCNHDTSQEITQNGGSHYFFPLLKEKID